MWDEWTQDLPKLAATGLTTDHSACSPSKAMVPEDAKALKAWCHIAKDPAVVDPTRSAVLLYSSEGDGVRERVAIRVQGFVGK